MYKVICASVLSVGLSPIASADEFDVTPLLRERMWQTDFVYSTQTGHSWCEAGTQNEAAFMTVTGWPSGEVNLLFFSPEWQFEPHETRVQVRLDTDVYDAHAVTDENGIFAAIEGMNGVAFVQDVRKRSALDLLDSQGRKMAAFSLSGAAAAMISFFECWARILPTPQTALPAARTAD